MNPPRCFIDGRPIVLNRLIGKGGEGEVYLIAGRSTHAVKLYKESGRAGREEKIKAMIQADLGQRSALAAFPLIPVQSHDGTFIGFVMRLMEGYQPIHEFYAPGPRKQHFPRADYRFLARVATNIAKAFASVHQLGCVVGDINHSGILVSQKATAALIDADSFQFSVNGTPFLCKVGVPEYTPPELQGKSLTGVVRTIDHDAFGLAVVLFQVLLMGRHPFIGRVRHGETPSYEESIRDFRYVYAEDRDVGMDPPPGTPAMSHFSPELASVFGRAFSREGLGRRPTAQEWVAVLERFENALLQCANNPLHYAPRNVTACSWCQMEQRLQTYLFAPYVKTAPDAAYGQSNQSTFTAANFDLRIVWGRIERVVVPELASFHPVLAVVTAQPTRLARAARKVTISPSAVPGFFLLVIAVIMGLASPKTWIFALALALLAVSRKKPPPEKPLNIQPFLTEFIAARRQWSHELDGWRRRSGLIDLSRFRDRLVETRDRYLGLEAEEREAVQSYHSQRREKQLYDYLEGFDLARADIRGIGHSKLAALASYGIDTAATVQTERILTVPGFGEFMTKRVWDWRERHAVDFVYNPTMNETDHRELARIRADYDNKASELCSVLMNGALQFEAASARTQEFARQSDPVLLRAQQRIAQANADLRFLGVPEPAIALAPAPPVGPPAPLCPTCHATMRQRTGDGGKIAFWGCTRFPECKGTRPLWTR